MRRVRSAARGGDRSPRPKATLGLARGRRQLGGRRGRCHRRRFYFPEVGIGLAPALVLAWLPRLIGERQAFWLTATGESPRPGP